MSNKVPQIRFNGYSDAWLQRKAKDLFIPVNERNREDLPVLSVTQDQGVVFRNDLAIDIKYDESTLSSYKVIHPGDFIISLRSFQGGFELSNVLGISSPAYTIFDFAVPAEQDKLYWKTIFKTFKFIESLKTVTFGIRDGKSISFKEFGDLKLNYPSDVNEQRRIGEFFAKLDETIAANQRKLDLLKEQKKGYLQKMFPKNGAKVPELRFAGFSEDWEERKLKDVVEKQIKGKAQFEKLAQGDVEYLDTSRLNGGQAILTNGLKDVTLDDILILWDGSKAGTVYHGFEGTLGSTLKAYRTSANSKFVYQYLKRHQNNIYNNYRTPNIPHVQKDFLNVFTISVPGSDEQAKIGSFFKKLDDTIALHQRKLDLLKKQKKGFLQQLFV